MIRGSVLRCDDRRPIEGAMVQLRDPQTSTKHTVRETESDGTFQLGQPGRNLPDIFVAAPGYEPFFQRVASVDQTQLICLVPKRESAEKKPNAP